MDWKHSHPNLRKILKWLTDQKPDFHGWKSLSSYKNKNVCRKEMKTLTGTGWIIPAWRTLAFKPCWNLVACTTICTRTGNTGVLSWRSNSVEERETLISYEICLGIFFPVFKSVLLKKKNRILHLSCWMLSLQTVNKFTEKVPCISN